MEQEMAYTSLASHISAHILSDTYTGTATVMSITPGQARLIDIPSRRRPGAESPAVSSPEHQWLPSTAAGGDLPVPPSSIPVLEGKDMILPKRLDSFLEFLKPYDSAYSKSFRYACKDLAVLEAISFSFKLAPKDEVRQNQVEKEVKKYLHKQDPTISFSNLTLSQSNKYHRILLGMMISGVQVGLLSGIGVLRTELEGLGEAVMGREVSNKIILDEWIEEGEEFVNYLEELRKVVLERYSGSVTEEKSESKDEAEAGEQEQQTEAFEKADSEEKKEDDDNLPPAIPDKSTRRVRLVPCP